MGPEGQSNEKRRFLVDFGVPLGGARRPKNRQDAPKKRKNARQSRAKNACNFNPCLQARAGPQNTRKIAEKEVKMDEKRHKDER